MGHKFATDTSHLKLEKLFLSQKNEFWAKNCAVVSFRSFRICSWIWQKFNLFSHKSIRGSLGFRFFTTFLMVLSQIYHFYPLFFNNRICPFVCSKCPFFPFWNRFYGFERKTVNRISKIWSFLYVSLIIYDLS